MKKKKGFYIAPTRVPLSESIPCLGKNNPYSGPESNFQKSSAVILAAYGLYLSYHTPNETRGKRAKPGEPKTAADVNRMILAGQGVRPGVSDWCIPHRTSAGHPGAYIELKAGKNGLDEDQIRFLNGVESEGYYCACIWNLDEFESVVKTLWPRRKPFTISNINID